MRQSRASWHAVPLHAPEARFMVKPLSGLHVPWLPRFTDLTDRTDFTDDCAETGLMTREDWYIIFPEISRHAM